MKLSQAIIFFGIVFTIYGLINFYIFRRAVTVIPENFKSSFLIVFVFAVIAYPAGRFLENYWVWYVSDFLVWFGAFWIAIMIHVFLLLIIVDLFRLVNHFIPFFPSVMNQNLETTRKITALIISSIVLMTVVGGFINTKLIAIKKYNLTINKKAGSLKSLNIVLASDLHLGTINGKMFAYKIVDKINKLRPDIVLFAGDIIDEDIKPVLRDNVGDALYELKAKYGIYGITGNHEYIGGVNDAVNYVTAHNIKMVRDSAIKIDDSFYLVGREDRDSRRFADYKRKDLKTLLVGVDKALPIILMDHQPFRLDEAEQNGVDLQLSGHTHNGQIWPFNYLVDKIYELSWGYKIKGDTHYYVSCGVGGWGPPIRTGSRPEIINIRLNFSSE